MLHTAFLQFSRGSALCWSLLYPPDLSYQGQVGHFSRRWVSFPSPRSHCMLTALTCLKNVICVLFVCSWCRRSDSFLVSSLMPGSLRSLVQTAYIIQLQILWILCVLYSTSVILHTDVVLLMGLVYGNIGECTPCFRYCEVAVQTFMVHSRIGVCNNFYWNPSP